MKAQPEKLLSSRTFSYFLQLVETSNYTQTAKLLGITQPALTQQIKKLEMNVGTPLFYTTGKVLKMTDAGQIMYTAIQEVFAILEDATNSIQKDSSETNGKIVIGISASIEEKVFSNFIIHYYQCYPEVEVTLLMVNRKEIWESLEAGKIDLAILYLPNDRVKNWKAYKTKTILKDEILFLHQQQNLFDKKNISIRDSLQYTWVTYPKNYFVSQVINTAFKNQETDLPESVAHFTKPAQMFKFSSETGVCTALPKSFFQAHREEADLYALPFEPAIDLELAFVFKEEKIKIPRIHFFMDSFDHYLQDENYISRLK